MCRSMNHLSVLVSMQFYPNYLITMTEYIVSVQFICIRIKRDEDRMLKVLHRITENVSSPEFSSFDFRIFRIDPCLFSYCVLEDFFCGKSKP
jgi:hypothetical protein